MDDDRFPVLFEVSSERSHALAGRQRVDFGGADRADVAVAGLPGHQLIFQVEFREGAWTLLPWSVETALSIDGNPVRGRVALQHRAIIQAGRHVFVFIEREDASLSSARSANQWLVGHMLKGFPSESSDDDSTAEQMPDDEPSDDERPHDERPDDERPDDEKTITQPPAGRSRLAETMSGDMTIRQTLAPGQFLTELGDEPASLLLPGEIELADRQMVIGRDSERVDICLPDLRVSRVHAWILRRGNTATIADLKSANGTFVDGQRVVQPQLIHEGSRIQIGPYSLVFTGAALFPLTHDNNAELVARNLVRRVPDRDNRGQPKVILDDVSLVIRPREFVCILGPSGSGKTTLLSALSGRWRADGGSVLLNGEDLYSEFDALKQNLAVVPQRDVLHDVLPLKAALWYSAKMRLPADMSRDDIHQRITEMLDAVRLTHRASTQIRRLSGGQTKRASWVNEAICNPSLIFLDEVTSGLDEQTDCEMMRLFRELADDGKTIVCVTHSVTYVEQNCDLLVILAPGGVLAFIGPPAAALEYFGITRLGDVYQRLGERPPEEWKERYRESRYFDEYVTRRLPEPADTAPEQAQGTGRGPSGGVATCWRQFRLMTRRYLAIQLADKKPLAMMIGQALFIATLLVWLFGNISNLNVESEARQLADVTAYGVSWDDLFQEDRDALLQEAEEAKRADYSAKALFLLCITCIWFGCNNAAKEIVKERSIYEKERDVGLNVFSYYGSKLTLLGAFSVLQATILYWCVRYFTQLGGDAQGQWFLLSMTSLIGVAMGLAISAISNTSDLAATIVPVSLIPQIIFAGLIAPLQAVTRCFSQIFISAYWGYQGLLGQLEDPLPGRLRDSDYLDLGSEFTPAVVGGVLMAHIILFSLMAITALYARDAKEIRLLRILRRRP